MTAKDDLMAAYRFVCVKCGVEQSMSNLATDTPREGQWCVGCDGKRPRLGRVVDVPAPLRILGIDPACTNAAAALLLDDNPRNPNLGRLERFWHIRPKGKTLAARVIDLARETLEILEAALPDVVVVELPADRPMGKTGFSKRSVLDLPNYGMAVGSCLATAAAWVGTKAELKAWDGQPPILLAVSVCDWTGRDVPSSTGDEHKTKRVAYVERLYGLAAGTLGAKTVAGNAADAVFLARWGLWRATAGAEVPA